jgi:hypothetical protein
MSDLVAKPIATSVAMGFAPWLVETGVNALPALNPSYRHLMSPIAA